MAQLKKINGSWTAPWKSSDLRLRKANIEWGNWGEFPFKKKKQQKKQRKQTKPDSHTEIW